MTEQEQTTLNHLLSILQGQKPLSDGEKVLAENVVFHMDHYKSRGGRKGWHNWMAFSREKGRITDLSVICDRMVANPNQTITTSGRWVGKRNGKEVTSDELSVTYRIEQGKIVEVWTTRQNYAFIFGDIIKSQIGLFIIYLQLRIWSWINGY